MIFFAFVWPGFNLFYIFRINKNTNIDILRTSVQFSAHELPSDTCLCIFGWCLYQNNLGLSGSLHSLFWTLVAGRRVCTCAINQGRQIKIQFRCWNFRKLGILEFLVFLVRRQASLRTVASPRTIRATAPDDDRCCTWWPVVYSELWLLSELSDFNLRGLSLYIFYRFL